MKRTLLQTRLNEAQKKHGGVRPASRLLDIDPAYFCRLRDGEKDTPPPHLLRALKLRRIVTYEDTERR